MVLDGPLLTQNAALSTVALVVTGALVWKLIRYARMRVALLPVSNIPGPSSQSFLLGKSRLHHEYAVLTVSAHREH